VLVARLVVMVDQPFALTPPMLPLLTMVLYAVAEVLAVMVVLVAQAVLAVLAVQRILMPLPPLWLAAEIVTANKTRLEKIAPWVVVLWGITSILSVLEFMDHLVVVLAELAELAVAAAQAVTARDINRPLELELLELLDPLVREEVLGAL